jgi:hypothetical protein
MPVITSPSQLFRFNERRDPTHTCYVFKLQTIQDFDLPKFKCSSSSGVLFRVRSFSDIDAAYTCELYLPKEGSPEYSNPQWLAVAVTTELVGWAGHAYMVQLLGVEDYSRYHSESTDEDECYI